MFILTVKIKDNTNLRENHKKKSVIKTSGFKVDFAELFSSYGRGNM